MKVGAVNVFEDNEEAIKLAASKYMSCSRTKHIDNKHSLIWDAPNGWEVRESLW